MEDYKKRFVTEYKQLAERLDKLVAIINEYGEGTLDFTPACPMRVLREQANAMREYKSILEERAVIEGVDLA